MVRLMAVSDLSVIIRFTRNGCAPLCGTDRVSYHAIMQCVEMGVLPTVSTQGNIVKQPPESATLTCIRQSIYGTHSHPKLVWDSPTNHI